MLSLLVRVLTSVVLIAALGWLAGRLLGVRQSWARALIAAVLGLSVGVVLALELAPQNPLPYPLFFLLVILLPSVLVSMGVSSLLELLARPGPWCVSRAGFYRRHILFALFADGRPASVATRRSRG